VFSGLTSAIPSPPQQLTTLQKILYPCLLFTSVILGINQNNIAQFGIMSVSAACYLSIGLILGFIILKVTNPPQGFRYGAVSEYSTKVIIRFLWQKGAILYLQMFVSYLYSGDCDGKPR
jgi:hypothetical protein